MILTAMPICSLSSIAATRMRKRIWAREAWTANVLVHVAVIAIAVHGTQARCQSSGLIISRFLIFNPREWAQRRPFRCQV